MSDGLTTAAAVLLAAILSPIVKVYDVLSGTEAAEKAEIERRTALFHPLYESRIAELKKRDPIQDARHIFQKEILFIPSEKEGIAYPGITWQQTDYQVPADNFNRLAGNPYIQPYMYALYPVDEQTLGEKPYHHVKYTALVTAYKSSFNREMYKLVFPNNHHTNTP